MTAFSRWALVSVVVAAAVLAALGWVSLRQWERSAELVVREQARDMAAMAAEKIEMVLRRAEDEVLDRLQAALASRDLRPDRLDAVTAASPLVAQLYLLDDRGRLVYPRALRPEDEPVYGRIVGEITRGPWERGRRELAVGGQQVVYAVVKGGDGALRTVAMVRNMEAVRRDVLEKTLGGLEAPTIATLLDPENRPVYAREPIGAAQRLASARLREDLPDWQVALYQPPGLSPHRTVRRQVMLFSAALGILLLVILAGSVTTYRLMRRESEVARLKADFVANVSHDLKTPLSVIRMFGETLEMGRVTDPAQRDEYYRVITRESERLSRLIDNVLDFSRIEGGRRTYERAPAPVEPLVRESLEPFAYPLAQGGFKVEVDVAADLPDVMMDAAAVGQALANLIDNAIKYSGTRKAVRVGAAMVGGELALSVADEGIGIAPAEHARVFEKFYRVGRSDTQGRRGSGVGLALVRHVAEAHGGRVTVESRPGEGSRFTIFLPVR